MKPMCTVSECEKQAHSRGWCHAHYKKWHQHGDPLHGKTYARPHGAGTVTTAGYIAVMKNGRKKQQHVLVMEAAIGRSVLPGEVVHHRDRNRQNNELSNLVLCASQAEHKELHLQEDAVAAGSPPHYRRCAFCRAYDDTAAMTKTGNSHKGHRHYHKSCNAQKERERKLK